MRISRWWALALACALATPAAADVVGAPETIRLESGRSEHVVGGVLQVPENRAVPGKRRIGIPW